MRHWIVFPLGSIVFLLGCGNSPLSPAAPTSVPAASTTDTAPFPPPAPPGTTRGLVGKVTGAGNVPIAGARVVVLAVGWYGGTTTEASVVTEEDGAYTMPAVRAYAGGDPVGWLLVGASKPGYFADFRWWLDFPKDADMDLRLEPFTRSIALGEVVRGQIGESECAGLGYGGWYGQRSPCQRYAIAVPASGTLEMTLSAPLFNFDVDVVSPDGTFAVYASSSSSPFRVRAQVEGGLTYEIRVAGGWSAAREFELTAVLR
jgi:hypothetical protein